MPTDVVSLLVSASIRACGLALVAYVSLFIFNIRSSAARNAVWTVVLIGMLLQIPLGVTAPAIRLEVLPITPAPIQPQVANPARTSVSPAPAVAPASHTRLAITFKSASSTVTLTRVYLAISLLLFFRMAFGYWVLRRILRGSTPILTLGPDIFESSRLVVPGSAGAFQTKILLPREWRDWDAPKLGAVLAHERAHIERHDCLIHLASRINTCIFWFHPLAWWINRELARLAEEACDDLAVSETNDKEEYAATLVEVAQTAAASARVLSWPVISMSSESNITCRVNRILKSTSRVPKPLGTLSWVLLCLWSVPVIYASAAVALAPARRNAITLHRGQSQREDRPLAMCILLDTSGSMREKRAEVIAAALALVKASKPHAEFCMISFDDEVFNGLPNDEDFTSNVEEVEESISRIDAHGGKAMRDAVQSAIERLEMKTHHESKAIVLITEGYDTSSKLTQEELLEKVKSSRVPVYSIGLLTESDPQRQEAARLELGQLADESGGRAFYPKNAVEAESISRQIADEAGNR